MQIYDEYVAKRLQMSELCTKDTNGNVRLNEFGQPIGDPVPDFIVPDATKLGVGICGRLVELEPLKPEHAEGLFKEFSTNDGRMWTYLSVGPFASAEELKTKFIDLVCGKDDPKLFAIIERSSRKPLGWGGFLRVFPSTGSVEIGNLAFSPRLQRTAEATEALYLMMKNSFDLGFRRCEWKCDSLNAPSERAARRLGFQYEGMFRQAVVYKGRNRDTKWFAVVDVDWPQLQQKFVEWLDPSNFDNEGKQIKKLRCCSE